MVTRVGTGRVIANVVQQHPDLVKPHSGRLVRYGIFFSPGIPTCFGPSVDIFLQGTAERLGGPVCRRAQELLYLPRAGAFLCLSLSLCLPSPNAFYFALQYCLTVQ